MHDRSRYLLGALALLAPALGAVLGCGTDPPPPAKIPTPAEMRNFWGLNPGSCWVYRDLGGDTARFIVSVAGPDTARIAGRTVYVVTRGSIASSGDNEELALDVDATPGKMFLARSVERSPNVTETYADEPRPLWGELGYVDGALTFAPNGSLESAATPRGATAAIAHAWTITSRDQMFATPDGLMAGLALSYSKDNVRQAMYGLVPNFGMATLQLDGVDYQVCKARVCDADNNCTGADSCAAASCQ